MLDPEIIYHTAFKEFKGASAEDVVQLLHEDSHRGTRLDFEQWWNYQERLWGKLYDIDVPKSNEEGAAQKLIDIMLRVGALEFGPKVAKDFTSRVQSQTGVER